MDYMRRTNMTPRPKTQEQATKQINAMTEQLRAIEAKRMEIVNDFTPEAVHQFDKLGDESSTLIYERHDLIIIREVLPTQAQYEYDEDMRLQEQIANDPYGGDDFMAYNMMGDCW